jgi:hypothetical protein
MSKDKWVWMPHAGHFIMGHYCRFKFNTHVNGFIVSTVGELWPERSSREIHAEVHDKKWFDGNRHLKGDNFDAAYMKRFGYEDIGCDRKYETMVFKAKKSSRKCCPYEMADAVNIDFAAYSDADAAYGGHLKMCRKLDRKEKGNG